MLTFTETPAPKKGLENPAKIESGFVWAFGQPPPSNGHDVGSFVVRIRLWWEGYVVKREILLCSTRDHSGRWALVFNPDTERDNVCADNVVLGET